MFIKKIFPSVLVSLLLGVEAGAVSLNVDGHPAGAGPAPVQGTLLLDEAAPASEPALGVLHIPLEEQSPQGQDEMAQKQLVQDNRGMNAIAALGFARVPLPAAAWLFGTAVVGIIAVSRRRPARQLT